MRKLSDAQIVGVVKELHKVAAIKKALNARTKILMGLLGLTGAAGAAATVGSGTDVADYWVDKGRNLKNDLYDIRNSRDVSNAEDELDRMMDQLDISTTQDVASDVARDTASAVRQNTGIDALYDKVVKQKQEYAVDASKYREGIDRFLKAAQMF